MASSWARHAPDRRLHPWPARLLVAIVVLAAFLLAAARVEAHHSLNALYTGTHSAGGAVQINVSADGSAVTRYRFEDVPCQNGLELFTTTVTYSVGGLPIQNHAFTDSDAEATLTGSFPQTQSVTGSYQRLVDDASSCVTGAVSFTATTTALPPQCSDGADNDGDGKVDAAADPGCLTDIDNDEVDLPQCSDRRDNDGDGFTDFGVDMGCDHGLDTDETDPDTTGPVLVLSGKKTQRLGKSVAVRVACPDEPCTARAAGRANAAGRGPARRYKLRAARAQVPRGGTATLKLRLPRSAIAAIKRALADGARVKAPLTITVVDAAGNRTTKRRTVALKR
jgi:hypothetical protein